MYGRLITGRKIILCFLMVIVMLFIFWTLTLLASVQEFSGYLNKQTHNEMLPIIHEAGYQHEDEERRGIIMNHHEKATHSSPAGTPDLEKVHEMSEMGYEEGLRVQHYGEEESHSDTSVIGQTREKNVGDFQKLNLVDHKTTITQVEEENRVNQSDQQTTQEFNYSHGTKYNSDVTQNYKAGTSPLWNNRRDNTLKTKIPENNKHYEKKNIQNKKTDENKEEEKNDSKTEHSKESNSREKTQRVSGKSEKHENKKLNPKTILVVSSWRSGSSFLGEMLAVARKDAFYSFEPLHDWDKTSPDSDDEREEGDVNKEVTNISGAERYMLDILRCNFRPYPAQVAHLAGLEFYRRWNERLTKACRLVQQCSDSDFVSKTCMTSSVHVVKVVRLPLLSVLSLLDELDDLQVVHLVRDPRPTMLSRQPLKWCLSLPECGDASTVCRRLMDDLSLVPLLQAKYPSRYKFLRYEDLSLDPVKTFGELWKFLDMKLTPRMNKALYDRTNRNTKKFRNTAMFGTYRNTKEHAFKWRKILKFKFLQKIQKACTPVLKILGLRIFHSEEVYKNMSLPVLVSKEPIFF